MKQNYIENSQKLSEKLKFSYWKFFVLAVMGAFFVGLGYLAYHCVISSSDKFGSAKYFIAAALFPVGLIFCVFLGGSLFTSDSTISLKFLEKKVKARKLFAIWGTVWVGNLVGSFLIACLCLWANLYDSPEMTETLTENVVSKASTEWYASIGSGIICNILVAGTVWIVNSLKSSTSKILIIWIIITLFVVSGTQHVVANMYVFWLGWLKQVDFSTFDAIFQNLIPTTLGNWIAGAVIIPGLTFVINHWTLKEV